MTTHIFNQYKRIVSQGKNLRIISDKAREYKGVANIKIERITHSKHYQALVAVYFTNGYHAVTNFADHAIAVKWATAKSERKGTWWTGCKVDVLT